jgi:hypothetical protein
MSQLKIIVSDSFERNVFLLLKVIKIIVAKRAKHERRRVLRKNTTAKNNTSTSYIPGHLKNPL